VTHFSSKIRNEVGVVRQSSRTFNS